MARCRGRGVDRAQSCRPLTRAVSHSTPWPDLLEPVALAVLDEPTQRVKHGAERRYGRRRSMTLHVDGPRRGTWKDFEESQGGASWPYRPTSRACTSLPPSIGCAGGVSRHRQPSAHTQERDAVSPVLRAGRQTRRLRPPVVVSVDCNISRHPPPVAPVAGARSPLVGRYTAGPVHPRRGAPRGLVDCGLYRSSTWTTRGNRPSTHSQRS